MKGIHVKKFIIITVALSGVIINVAYGLSLLNAFFSLKCDNAIREIIISGIALEFGWVALLSWMIFKPVERRFILLFSVIPLLLANILQSTNQCIYLHKSPSMIALNIGIGVLYAGLYVGAYFLGESC
jgi:hypothetical protein